MNNTAEKPIDRRLFDISMTAINIAALGRIVRDIAEASFTEEETSDYLTRLSALGECIDGLGQQIANQIEGYDMPRSEQ